MNFKVNTAPLRWHYNIQRLLYSTRRQDLPVLDVSSDDTIDGNSNSILYSVAIVDYRWQMAPVDRANIIYCRIELTSVESMQQPRVMLDPLLDVIPDKTVTFNLLRQLGNGPIRELLYLEDLSVLGTFRSDHREQMRLDSCRLLKTTRTAAALCRVVTTYCTLSLVYCEKKQA